MGGENIKVHLGYILLGEKVQAGLDWLVINGFYSCLLSLVVQVLDVNNWYKITEWVHKQGIRSSRQTHGFNLVVSQGTVLIKNAKELLNFSKGEEDMMEAQMQAIKETGANVVVTGGKVADMALHYANKYNLMVVR